ncbi:MAG TPA: EB domain-containing protein [Polyangia bacterium]|nr:EB domain-containing protein [Polyangia bacterium]
MFFAGVGTAVAKNALDPFRPAGSSGTSALAPFVAQAGAAPAGAPAATAPRAPAAAPLGQACGRDDDCPDESICERGVCQAIQTRTNILYLYYQEGTFREVLGLYWSKRGASGYRVIVPLYWHYWSPGGKVQVVAPFYWRFEDYTRQRTTTVIVPGLPISWTSEPGASSWAVWPLAYNSTRYGWAAPLFGTFTLKDPQNKSALGAALFFYWWKRAPGRSFDLLFPLFVSKRSTERAFTFALPLNFYWRAQDDATTLALPFFYRHTWKTGGSFFTWLGYHTRSGAETTGSVLWLYWFRRNGADRAAHAVLFPILWHFQSKSSSSTVFFPFVWSFTSPGSTTNVVPVPFAHVYVRRGSWYLNTIFALWWNGGDDKAGYTFATFFPLLHWQRYDHGKKTTWLSLLGGYHRDDNTGSRTLALLPFFLAHRNSERQLHVLSPLFIRHRNNSTDATTKLVGGLLYLRDDPAGSTSVLFPLFWRFRDAPTGATATMFFPFFAHRAGPRDTSTFVGVFPLWFYKRSFPNDGWAAGLFPLAFFGQRDEGSHAVVFPLYWRFGDGRTTTTVGAPLFYTRADPRGRNSAIFPLLTFFGNRDGEHYTVQFPLYWRFSSERQGWATTVTPLGYFHSGRQGWSLGVGPLLPLLFAAGGGPKSHFALFPLFWHFRDDQQDRSTTVVLLYKHRQHGGETTDALFPLFHYRRGARPGGADETSFTLFPLVHYRRDAVSRVMVTPLGASVKSAGRDAGFVGPFFWYRDANFAARALLPAHVDVTRLATGERTRMFGPWFQIDAPQHKSRVLFPLYGTYQDQHETDTYVFPSYFRRRGNDGYEVDALLPLYWHSSYPGGGTTVVASWYRQRAPGVYNTGLAPLWMYAKNQQRSVTIVPPALLYRRRDFVADTTRLWAGPVYHSRDQAAKHRTVVFPLWWSGHEQESSHALLLPFYWHFANSRLERSTTVAGPLFWMTRGQDQTRGLVPLFWYSRNSAQESGSTAVFPFFYRNYRKDGSAFYTLLAGYSSGRSSSLWYVGPVLSKDSEESRFRMLFPLWFHHLNKPLETKTLVIPPLLTYSRSNPEGALTTVLGLFWHRRDIASSTSVGFPLYYDFHDFHQTRTTVVLPLLLRHQRDSDGSVFWLAPLFYRHSTPTDVTMVGFPLLWHFQSGKDKTTVLFPFYAHWRRSTHAATYIFPTYYYREGLRPDGSEDGTWRRVVAPFFESAVKRPGDYMWEVLGGVFGRENIGRNRYLKVFFMSFETQAPSHSQTSWFSQPARVSRRTPTRSLSANVW